MTTATLSHLTTLADPTRARLLVALEGRELSVGELAAALQLPQSTVSRHLKVLSDDGWVANRPDGTTRFYRMLPELDDRAAAIWGVVRDELLTEGSASADLERVEEVLAERRQRTREFFSTVSGRWGSLRRELYGDATDQWLLTALLDPRWSVGDFGCGDGRLTELLAAQVSRVVAVDASVEMLEAARGRLAGVANVELHLSDLETLPVPDASLDLGMLSLVLPWLPQPGRALAEAARTLKPGGRLIVMDMVAHQQEELRRTLGQVWSGFAEAQVREWMDAAGLTAVRIRAVPLAADAKGPGLFVATGRRPGG